MKRASVSGLSTLFIALLLLWLVPSTSSNGPDTGIWFTGPSSQGQYDGTGVPAPLYWTGDGNIVNNTSFEGTYQPWVPVQSNTVNNAPQIVAIGYDGSSSVRVPLISGDFSNNNFWDLGEAVLYDTNGNGIYDPGEPKIGGPTTTLGSLLQRDPFIKYNDTNSDLVWTPGETVIVDVDLDLRYSTNDIIISGNPPTLGTVLRDDVKLTFVDQSADSNHSLLYDLSREQVGFDSSLRLRGAILVESLTGTTLSDRAEVTIVLTTSLGRTLAIHYFVSRNADNPTNTTSDAYYRISNMIGQWVLLDRNVPLDAQQAFSSSSSNINSAAELRLSSLARTQPTPNDDSRLKYGDTNGDGFWGTGEPLVNDVNNNSVYDGDQFLSGIGPPAPGSPLKDDPRIKFVDSNSNGSWNTGSPGESIIYDKNNNGQWDAFVSLEVVMYGATPTQGTLLQKPARQTTQALFDRVELYSATGNYDWVRNGAFTNSLSGWTTGSFTTSSSVWNKTSPSAAATITNGAAELDQSIDGSPRIESWLNFTAAARVATMTGTSNLDIVDILLGMVDNRGYAFSLYYVFRTGDLNLPLNDTDTTYLRAGSFGVLNQWISIDRNLQQDTQDFSTRLGFTPPFRIELLSLEVTSSGPSTSTSAYFDDISLYQAYKYGQATSHFYAVSGANSTYVYSANSIPQGTFYLDVPRGQTVLNITTPEGSRLATGQYAVQVDNQADTRRIIIPGTAMFSHNPAGDWTIFTTSTNALARLYVEDPVKKTENSTLQIGSTANLVSRSIDPLGRPIVGTGVNLTLWNAATGTTVISRTGLTDSRGWFNVTGVDPSAGTYILEATTYFAYAGVSDYSLSLKYTLTVSLSLSTSQVPQGRSVTIAGDVTPPTQGTTVTIYYRLAGNTQRTQLATVNTDSAGKYSYTWTPVQGDYEVTATVGDSSTASAESGPKVVFVGPPEDQLGTILAIIGIGAATSVVAFILLRRRKMGHSLSAH